MLKRGLKMQILILGLILLFLSPIVEVNAAGEQDTAAKNVYQDPHQPIHDRVEDLLKRMTLAEKVGQMTQIEVTRLMGNDQWDRGPLNDRWLHNILVQNKAGSILSGGGSAPIPNTPRAWAELTNAVQRYALEHSRLKIPIIYGVDAVHGHNTVLGATIYPHNIGMGATWNPSLVEKVAAATAKDVAATGIHWNFAPVGDLGLDPRWGRFYETYGEDPYLAGILAAAAVEGLQKEQYSTGVAATAKHFVGYSLPAGGQDRANADLSLRNLREIHYPPFEMMIAKGVGSIMPNSGTVNSIPVHASHYLLTDVLRDQMGFQGVVVSDWEDILKLYTTYRIAVSYRDAIRISINAGVDMSMVPHDAAGFTANLISLVEEGLVPPERIDQAVRRILTLKFELGLFEQPYVDPNLADQIILNSGSRLAKEAALESITLLKNENGLLPLAEDLGSILVVGSNSNNITSQMGGWTIGWQGAFDPRELPPAVTVLEGIKSALPNSTVHHATNASNAAKLATHADLIVVVAGEGAYAEGSGDDAKLELSRADRELIETLTANGKKIVLVLIAGRPLIITDIVDSVQAVVMAYYPGSEGGNAVADVLFGLYNPSGRLPFSWPHGLGQLPVHHNQWITSSYEPLYAFGYGLSYTDFAYTELVAPAKVKKGETVNISVKLTNRGVRSGQEVVQLYLSRSSSPTLPRRQMLVDFVKVELEPQESMTVRFELAYDELAAIAGDILGDDDKAVHPGEYTVSVGGRSAKFIIQD